MTTPIDGYLAGLGDQDRRALEVLRHQVLDVIPDAEECLSYNMPAFRVRGKVLAGFAAFAHHLGFFPHSGTVIAAVPTELLDGVDHSSKGTIRFTADQPLSDALVEALIREKAHQAGVVLRRGAR